MSRPIVIPQHHVADIELPRELEKLYDLAYNLWWTWHRPARQVFASIDAEIYARYRNPVQLLLSVEPAQWEKLLQSDYFLRNAARVIDDFERYLRAEDTWFAARFPGYAGGPMAYFSMEYGVHQSLALYSGGLGVLSGDHCKSASDLGLPFVAVGLLYRHGYFRQTIDADGRQQHTYPEYDFHRLPIRPAMGHTGREVVVKVPLPEREVAVKVWVAQVGRVPLVLLDTDIPQNDPADRPITNILYIRGREMRLVQEMVLGIGGARALEALRIEPAVWHMNEGHSALLQLERVRALVARGSSPQDARARVSRDAVFTTHTPVPAGNEQFSTDLVRRYLAPQCERARLSVDEVLAWGDAQQAGSEGTFNLTAVALRLSSFANGVSRLNAEVAGQMWEPLFAQIPGDRQPIRPITNGVHPPTWVGEEMMRILTRALGAGWSERLLAPEDWARILEVPDDELWQAHLAQAERLGRFLRSRLRDQFARHGHSPEELRVVSTLFRADTLTIGFARRFATYKRASLIFSDLDRLHALLSDSERPVQILFAGKAHPADLPGQELIQRIFELSLEARFRGRVFFLEDYDMRVAAMLVQGVDVWLNTPRRPMEASGTSGQKAAMNGALNVSVLDGWWPEAWDGENGWVIGNGDDYASQEEQDLADALSLYRTLAESVIPTYYDLDDGRLPRRWIAMMKRSLATVTPNFSSLRMVRDYAVEAYIPAAGRSAY
jgi:starch phosphorylase